MIIENGKAHFVCHTHSCIVETNSPYELGRAFGLFPYIHKTCTREVKSPDNKFSNYKKMTIEELENGIN